MPCCLVADQSSVPTTAHGCLRRPNTAPQNNNNNNNNGGGGGNGLNDSDAHAQRVEALYERMQRLAPLAGDLPALVGRLQALQGLHAESLGFR